MENQLFVFIKLLEELKIVLNTSTTNRNNNNNLFKNLSNILYKYLLLFHLALQSVYWNI